MDLRRQLVKKIQRVFWIYLGEIFVVLPEDLLPTVHPKVTCEFVAITRENCSRVEDFREKDLAAEFLEKVLRGEKGFFAVRQGHTAGSIWATINQSKVPTIVRGFMKLMPQEALIHDIVTGVEHRGIGIGPFMVTQILPILFQRYGVSRVVIDVNVKNTASLKMMDKAGLHAKQRALAISAFQKLAFHKTLKEYD